MLSFKEEESVDVVPVTESIPVTTGELRAQTGTPDILMLSFVQSLHDLMEGRVFGVSYNNKSKYVRVMRSIQVDLKIALICAKEFNYLKLGSFLMDEEFSIKKHILEKCFKKTTKDQEEKKKALTLLHGIYQRMLTHLIK